MQTKGEEERASKEQKNLGDGRRWQKREGIKETQVTLQVQTAPIPPLFHFFSVLFLTNHPLLLHIALLSEHYIRGGVTGALNKPLFPAPSLPPSLQSLGRI